MNKEVAIYARVSTRRQKEGDTVENQLRELRKYVKNNGYKVYGEYIDNGYSGSSGDRPQLNELFRDAQNKRFSAVVVLRLDRLGRSLRHLIDTIEKFKELGVDFISLKESFDTSTTTGKLLFHIVGAIAEFEREIIRERIQSGMRRKKEDGKDFGKIARFVDIRKVYDLREQGMSLRKIGSIVGLSRTRIAQLLTEKDAISKLVKLGRSPREIAIHLKIQESRARSIINCLESRNEQKIVQ